MKDKHQKIPMLTYDTKRMNEDIPIREVIASYANIRVTGRGNNIHCPSPEHTDRTPSAKIYGNVCKCFSCGRRLTPISLAKEYNPQLSFKDVCRKLLDDFGLNIYDYSNLREIENIKNSNQTHTFYDYFPVTDKDLKFIGLNNPTGDEEYTYAVNATDYYMGLVGEIPPLVETHDENGKELLINCTHSEAIILGLIVPNAKEIEDKHIEEHEYMKIPTIQQLWQDDKIGTEEMIIGKCYEVMDIINQGIAASQTETEKYQDTHDENQMKEARLLDEGFSKALEVGKLVHLSETQKEKIDGFNNYETNKGLLHFLNHELNHVDKILQTVLEHGKEREKELKKEKKQQQER